MHADPTYAVRRTSNGAVGASGVTFRWMHRLASSQRVDMPAPGPRLTPQEENSLGWAIINEGCVDSRNRLAAANIHLVHAIASHYQGRGLELQALVSRGWVGLVRAADKFDPAQGSRFSTQAAWWIKQSMRDALAEVRPIATLGARTAASVWRSA